MERVRFNWIILFVNRRSIWRFLSLTTMLNIDKNNHLIRSPNKLKKEEILLIILIYRLRSEGSFWKIWFMERPREILKDQIFLGDYSGRTECSKNSVVHTFTDETFLYWYYLVESKYLFRYLNKNHRIKYLFIEHNFFRRLEIIKKFLLFQFNNIEESNQNFL